MYFDIPVPPFNDVFNIVQNTLVNKQLLQDVTALKLSIQVSLCILAFLVCHGHMLLFVAGERYYCQS